MSEKPHVQFIRLKPWQIWLGGAFAAALGLAAIILAAGLFLILAPVLLVAGMIYRFRNRAARQPAPEEIEVNYRVDGDGRRSGPGPGLRRFAGN